MNLKKKSRKHANPDRQYDIPSKERFDCNGMLKITIEIAASIFQVYITHKYLHPPPSNHSVSDSIKDFIKENINLLPREIYAKLVSNGMDLSIRQKQVHFWWSKFMADHYKRDENAFISARKWLEEYNFEIILYLESPVQAIGFMTGLDKIIERTRIRLYECGMDATCK